MTSVFKLPRDLTIQTVTIPFLVNLKEQSRAGEENYISTQGTTEGTSPRPEVNTSPTLTLTP